MPPKPNHDQSEKSSALERGLEIVAAAKKDIAGAEVTVEHLRDAGLTARHENGPLTQAYLRGQFPVKREPSLAAPDIKGQPSLMDLVNNIITSYRAGRRVTTAACLVELRKRYERLESMEAASWADFINKYLVPAIGLDPIERMIGSMVHRGGLLQCIECGAKACATCGCGVVYLGEHNWSMSVVRTIEPATENATENRGRGRPPSDSAMTSTERSRKRRERQRNSAPPIDPDDPPNLLALQEFHPDTQTPEERWRWSLDLLAGDAMAMAAHWDKTFPGWREWEWPSATRTNIEQAAIAWQQLRKIITN